ncbi:MAG: DUF4349 domain-containing protein [Lachnospiraceae bacterium]|nr:DUF4349 domain-containing protein [Lachnospiraceae bacterium]
MKKRFLPVISLILLSLMVAACGSSKSSDAGSGNYKEAPRAYADDYDYAPEMAMATEDYEAYEDYDTSDVYTQGSAVITDDPGAQAEITGSDTPVTDTSRKLIKTVNLSIETEEFDELIENINTKVERLGGYIESSYVGGRSYGSTQTRSASITARIPAIKLDEFTTSVTENSNVLSKNDSTEDVTLNYVDMQAKVESLKTERERLNELLAQADDLEVILALEERLAEVRYEIESYESRLRVMDNQVTYSTVYLDIEEVTKYTPTVTHERTLGERMGEAFADSLEAMSELLKDLAVWLVGALPFLLLIAIIAGIILLIVMAASRGKKKKGLKPLKKGAGSGKTFVAKPGQNFDPMTGKPIENKDKDTTAENTSDTDKKE